MQPDVSDVGHPKLVDAGQLHPAGKVKIDLELDELGNVVAKMIQIAVLIGVDLLPLQSLNETFAAGIVNGFDGRLMLGIIPCLRSRPT
jgi:hypothetical protein